MQSRTSSLRFFLRMLRGAGSPSHNALRMKYIIDCRLSRDLLVVSGVRGVRLGESTTSIVFVVKVMRFWPYVVL